MKIGSPKTYFKKGHIPITKGKKGLWKLNETNRKNISNGHQGQIPWNKGKKGLQVSWNKGKTLSKETIKKMIETRKKNNKPAWNKGIPNFKNRGKNNHEWKGGITPINEKIRKSLEYKLWREAVFARDNYQCVFGGKEHGRKLNADHIKPFALFPELRFAIDNGRTLCVECHRKTDTWGNKSKTLSIN